jgi:hypothetical protein
MLAASVGKRPDASRSDVWNRGQDAPVKRLIFLTRVAGGLVASFGAFIRRLRHGPTLPTWTWSEELFVAMARSTASVSARDVGLMSPRRRGPRPPLGRAARAALTVEDVNLGGVRAER